MSDSRSTDEALARQMLRIFKGQSKAARLTGSSTDAAVSKPGFSNPMTSVGDLITGGVEGSPKRLGVGADDQVLTVVAGEPAWADATGGGGGSGSDYLYWTADDTATEPIWLMDHGRLVRRA